MRGFVFILLFGLVGCVEPQVGTYDLPPPGFDEAPRLVCEAGERTTLAIDVPESEGSDIVARAVGKSKTSSDVHVASVGRLKQMVVVWREGHAMRAQLYDGKLRPTRALASIDDRDVVHVDVAAHDGKILAAALVRGERQFDVIATEHACVVR